MTIADAMAFMDAEVAKSFQKILTKQGLKFVLGAAVQKVDADKKGAKVTYKLRKDESEAAIEAEVNAEIRANEAVSTRLMTPDDAVAAGATLLAGGGCEGNMLEAALLENVPGETDVVREEAFGPVVILSKFSQWEDALAEVNDSKFGLQAGLFTSDLHKVLEAWDHLDVGGIVVNDVSSYRVDNMPYGGVKDSGLGREGVRFAIEDMSEIRNLVIRRT